MTAEKKYKILKEMASGGTAVLYKAIQTSLDRVVAVKQLHQHLTADENFTRRFILEAKAAASLDHDNIVKIIDFGSEEDVYLMVMEFIEGESLQDILDRWKRLPFNEALAIAHQVCLGLEHAHGKGIVHRDIKPGNIMVTREGRAKITDFGLAKLTQTTTQHTADNSILGTPLYMSPEQAFGESVDNRSDLFSLGTMLYEMLTGNQPFRDENYMAVIQNIIHSNAPHPSKFDVDIPPPIQSILGKAMNKNRDARFQSAAQFKQAIEKYLGLDLNDAAQRVKSLLVGDGDTVQLTAPTAIQPRRRPARKGMIAGITAALVVGALGVGYTLDKESFEWQIDQLKSTVVAFAGDKHEEIAPTEAADNATAQDSTIEDSGDGAIKLATAGIDESISWKLQTVVDSTQPAVKTTAPSPSPPATESEPAVAEKRPVVRKGWLNVRVEPAAEIYIDGVYVGDSPLRRELTRGPHALECRHPRHVPYREDVNITSGELSTRSIVLQKLKGRVSIITDPGAEVYVDGKFIGITPIGKVIELDVGAHQLTIKKAGFNVWNNEISLEADQSLPLTITLSPIY